MSAVTAFPNPSERYYWVLLGRKRGHFEVLTCVSRVPSSKEHLVIHGVLG